MKIIDPSYEILDQLNGPEILRKIERIGRVCYKSEDKIAPETAEKFAKMLIDRGHEAMIEHASFAVKFIVDRGVSHELVRHRPPSFAQESTRYCNYGKANEVVFIRPSADWAKPEAPPQNVYLLNWLHACEQSERSYLNMVWQGASPQEARSVLPNSLKTEIVVTANLREWRHIFSLRTSSAAHPDMQAIMRPLCLEMKTLIPVIFDDISW